MGALATSPGLFSWGEMSGEVEGGKVVERVAMLEMCRMRRALGE